MKIQLVCYVLLMCLLLALSGCKSETKPEPVVAGTVVTEAVETTAAAAEVTEVTEPAGPVLLERQENGKVCVGFMPTEAGAWRYVVLPDQEAAVAAYEQAVGAIYSDEWWIKGDRTKGLMVVYDEIWDFVESGELVYALGRVKAEDAAALYALCEAAAREAGWKEPVKPEQLIGLVSAKLRLSGQEKLLTDVQALDQLESMLSSGKYSLGGTGCPLNGLLEMETENGDVLTVALATDSCGVWMSEGYYYDFGSDSAPLYDLFGVKLEFGQIAQ